MRIAVLLPAMTAEPTEDDRGKSVLLGSEPIGTVTEVRGGTVYVDPDFANVPETLRRRLGWREGDRPYTIESEAVAAVAGGAVRLRDDLD